LELTDYHAKYFAAELTKRSSSDSLEKLAGAVVSAQVDLNPHQVDAALFAFRSPFSTGALLADEVGLGKTIEAGLVISQRWAERKQRILVITPSNLRKQWHQELNEKFFIPCIILESKSYNQLIKQGKISPFEASNAVVICSYHFARSKAYDIQLIPWDLVVIDEAHRLRNVYKPTNVIANTLKQALLSHPKLLLTATPLQNSILELFGLVSFIDDHAFGDLRSFRSQYVNQDQQQIFDLLKERLKPLCHRTLRRQVGAYVSFTRRFPLVQEFSTEESEDRLYDLVSDYLRRDNLQALPSSQRSLMTLVLRKLLASSSFAIAGALTTMSNRLKSMLGKKKAATSLEDDLSQDYEALDETSDEWPDEQGAIAISEATRVAIEAEITDLDTFAKLAISIQHNAKGRALLKALEIAFAKATQFGAAQKAIIFTESLRTQNYLLRVLADSQFSDGIVLFNGSNNDERSKQIYNQWFERHRGTDRVTGSRTADMRSALVDYFKDRGRIMIATEAAAEGINLQFCSLVVNYDLPWNPQRIEQRIGRCHRYGQKHDVVVVNFLNRKNAADQRVFQLLSEKFRLFEGVFGASDEVLGSIESGIDFEKRVAEIYQRCRQPDEIQAAFDQLQMELDTQIDQTLAKTRQQLLENFDDEVREKLRLCENAARANLNRYENLLMQLTHHELKGLADFPDDSSFNLKACPFARNDGAVPLGLYELPRRTGEAHLYRLNHPLAEAIISLAKQRDLMPAEMTFDYSAHEGKITILESLLGKVGWLNVVTLTVEALDQIEDRILFSAVTDDGQVLSEEQCGRLLTLSAIVGSEITIPASVVTQMEQLTDAAEEKASQSISERNARFFEIEVDKLDRWADDLKLALEREIKDLDIQLKEARRTATVALTLEDKLTGQKQVKSIELLRNEKRRSLFEAQDQVDKRREELIARIEGKLIQKINTKHEFTIRWRLV
jgi:ERCC4-related helicase